MAIRIAVPKERREGERRVALTPESCARMIKKGFEVFVEKGAGELAFFSDNDYEKTGAVIISELASLYKNADIVLKVNPPSVEDAAEIDQLRSGSILIGFLNPFGNPELIKALAERGIVAFAMELIPRIGRAQSMDALSSQASIAGYKAVIIAAGKLGKFFPFLTTAAGTLRPARVLVVGAGVAGLQAIATARRLGAEVEAFDIRPAVKEEVQSLGAKFIDIEVEEETGEAGGYAKEVSEEAKKRERAVLARHVSISDVVITTAQVPGKRAPLLITKEMVASMKAGSVIIDLAAEQGGNCELTRAGEDTLVHGVTIVGAVNLPSTVPTHASQMYAKNVSTLAMSLVKEGEIHLDFADEIINQTCLTHNGQIRNEKVLELLGQVAG